jgi:RNA polymerase sigma-70 factor (ECF subfamily)
METTSTLEQLTDEQLVARSLKNPDDFAHLIRRYDQKLIRYIRRSTGASFEETEDLLQEVFLKVYQHLNDFDQKLKFSSWIYRITYNHIVSNHRKKMARPETYRPEEDELEQIASKIDIAEDLEKKELNQNIRAVLDKLDPKYKEVLILQFIEEKSYQEKSSTKKKSC